jgi:hypothetical protein
MFHHIDWRKRGAVGWEYNCVCVTAEQAYTDKKENKIFLIYKEIQSGAVATLYVYEEGLPNL